MSSVNSLPCCAPAATSTQPYAQCHPPVSWFSMKVTAREGHMPIMPGGRPWLSTSRQYSRRATASWSTPAQRPHHLGNRPAGLYMAGAARACRKGHCDLLCIQVSCATLLWRMQLPSWDCRMPLRQSQGLSDLACCSGRDGLAALLEYKSGSKNVWTGWKSNPGPLACEASALPTELPTHNTGEKTGISGDLYHLNFQRVP